MINDENEVLMRDQQQYHHQQHTPTTPSKRKAQLQNNHVQQQQQPLQSIQGGNTPIKTISTPINNNKRKRTSFHVFSDKKRSVLVENSGLTEQQQQTVRITNSSIEYEELLQELHNTKTLLQNCEADITQYKTLFQNEASIRQSNEKELFSLRSQNKYYKEGLDKLRMEFQLLEKDKGRLLEQVKESESIADQWQTKFKEQQTTLNDKFEMFKTLREQSKELELEVSKLKTINNDLEQRLLKKNEDKKIVEPVSVARKGTNLKKTVPANRMQHQQQQQQQTGPSNYEFDRLREEYECVKAANDVFRDERNSLEERIEKNAVLIETLQVHNAQISNDYQQSQAQLIVASNNNTQLTSQLSDITSKLQLLETQLEQVNQTLKQERSQYTIQLEDLENQYKQSQLSDRYKELLVLNTEYKRQADTVTDVIQNMDGTLDKCSTMTEQVGSYHAQLLQVTSVYQTALHKAKKTVQEYKQLCMETENRLTLELEDSLKLTEQLKLSTDRERALVQESTRLNSHVMSQQTQIDDLTQQVFALQQELSIRLQDLYCLQEELYMQTAQVNGMLDHEIPEFQEAIIKLQIANVTKDIINNVISRQCASEVAEVQYVTNQYQVLKNNNLSMKKLLEQTEQDMYILYKDASATIALLQERVQRLQSALTDSDARYMELLEYTQIEKNVLDETVEQEKANSKQLLEQCGQLETNLIEASNKLQQMQEHNQQLTQHLEHLNMEKLELQVNVQALNEQNQMYMIAQQDWISKEKVYQRDLVSVRNEADQLRIIRSSLEQELRNGMASEQKLKDEISQYQSDITKLQSELETLRSVVPILDKEREQNLSLQLTINQMESKLQQHGRQLEQANDKRQELEMTIVSQQDNLTTFEAEQLIMRSELGDALEEIEHLKKIRCSLECNLSNTQIHVQTMTERFKHDLNEQSSAISQLERELKDKNFELVRYRGLNKQLTLELELLLSKTQKSDWLKGVETAVFDLILARKDIQQLNIEVTCLTQQLNHLSDNNVNLKNELSERIRNFKQQESIWNENTIRIEKECKHLASLVDSTENVLTSMVSDHPDLQSILKQLQINRLV
jgi:chromosome segregation ATPase